MSALSDLATRQGTTSTSALSRLAQSSTPQSGTSALATLAQTGKLPPAPLAPTPAPQNEVEQFFNAKGYAPANSTDTSGKPFAMVPMAIPKTFASPETQATVIDKTRVASPIDPTVPQRFDRSLLQNGRMPQSASQSIKQSLGGTTAQELDHIMPLELGGSNTNSNLRLETLSAKGTTATDPIENQLAYKAYTGQISVLDAWRQMAQAKGITLKEDSAKNNPVQNFLLNTPSILKPLAAIQNGISNAAGAVKNFFSSPSKVADSLGEQAILHPITTLNNIVSTAKQGADATIQNLVSAAKTAFANGQEAQKTGNYNDPKHLAGILNLVTAAASTAFFPVGETFNIASQLPIIKPAADAAGIVFDTAGKVVSFSADKLFQALPISPEAKQVLAQPIHDIASLAGQMTVGAFVFGKVTGLMESKPGDPITAADVKSIVAEAQSQTPVVENETKRLTPDYQKPFSELPPEIANKVNVGYKGGEPLTPEERATLGESLKSSPYANENSGKIVASAGKQEGYLGSHDINGGTYHLLMDQNGSLRASPTPIADEQFGPTTVKDQVQIPEANPNPVVQLHIGVNPNIDKFIEQDVKPAAKGFIGGVTKTWDFIKKTVTPTLRGPEAETTASILREGLGRMARDKEMVYQSLAKARKTFDSYSPEDAVKVIDSIESGKPLQGYEQFADTIRTALDTRWKKIQDIKGTDAYIKDYFPHLWEDPTKAESSLVKYYSKRPFEGTKSYLQERTIPTFKEGIDLGLKPVSYNPVDSVMARVADMDKFIMANDVWGQLKDQGLRKFVETGETPPTDWIKVNDKISNVFQFSEAEKGLIQRGAWYLPEKAATILNNYLSPGLAGNPLYDGFRMLSNTLNQVQLGMSGFHALFTSGDAVISKAALELQKVFNEPALVDKAVALGKAIAAPVTAPYLSFKNFIKGNALLTDYFKENPEVPALVDALERAGGRVRMDSFYKNDSITGFLKALRGENYLGATARAPGAIIEAMAKPIMEGLVPRQKLGIFSDMAESVLNQAKNETWSEEKTTLRLQEAWDSVDNRMGQLVYDNLFWNKALKDLGMASTRSLGWNLGTFRELGAGAAQLAEAPIKAVGKATGLYKGEIRMTPKMAYTVALPYVVGMWGAAIYYLYNKSAPQSLLDYFYPKTGKTKPDGTPERIALPSYMKDIFAYTSQPLQTISNKLHPEISAIMDMFQNKDYYGTEIRNPNDPIVKQIGELFAYQAQQFVPFTITNLINRSKAEGPSWNMYLQSFMGITPAPAYITRTPLQTRIYNLYDQRFPSGAKSTEQAQASQLKANIRTQYMLGNSTQANQLLQQAVQQGIIKPNGVQQFIREADIPSDIKLFQQLPAADQESLLKDMQLYDLQRYAWYANSTVKSKLSSLSDNAKAFVGMESRGDVKEPVWKRGQIAP